VIAVSSVLAKCAAGTAFLTAGSSSVRRYDKEWGRFCGEGRTCPPLDCQNLASQADSIPALLRVWARCRWHRARAL
jgi:hypothetical protein